MKIRDILTDSKAIVATKRQRSLTEYFNKRWMLLDFYEGRQDKPEYLENKGFQGIKKPLPLGFINLTRKIIQKNSMVYKYPPNRIIGNGDNEKWGAFIKENPNFNQSLQKAEDMVNLFHNILFRPVFTSRGYRWWIDTEWIPHCESGDPFNPYGYSIPVKQDVNQTDPGKVDKDWYMYISEDQYYWYVPGTDDKQPAPGYEDYNNPFGCIPIVEMRKDLSVEEYWPDGAVDLVLANQNININWNNLNYAIHYQSFDQAYVTGVDGDAALEVERDHAKLWRSPEGSSFGILGFNPKIMEIMEAIKTQCQIIANSYNVSLDWVDQAQPQSGFALVVRNLDMIEEREKAVQRYKVYEDKIYKILRIQGENIEGANEFDDDDFSIDFQEIDLPVSAQEERSNLEFRYQNNISTPVETIQSENPDLSLEEAEKKYMRNKELNARLTRRQETFLKALEE